MRLITTNLYIIIATLAIGIITPNIASGTNPKSNETSTKSPSTKAGATTPHSTKETSARPSSIKIEPNTPYSTKETVEERPGINLSEK